VEVIRLKRGIQALLIVLQGTPGKKALASNVLLVATPGL
jgi:hypothetical protein